DRPAPHKVLATDPRNRVHALHPPATHPDSWMGSLLAVQTGGSILDADPPPQGVKIARRFTHKTLNGSSTLTRLLKLFISARRDSSFRRISSGTFFERIPSRL